jgi:hypothetical protein
MSKRECLRWFAVGLRLLGLAASSRETAFILSSGTEREAALIVSFS